MNRQELSDLEKEIKAELTALQVEQCRFLSERDHFNPALEKNIETLAGELAMVRAEKRCFPPAPPTPRSQELRQLTKQIAALQEEIVWLARELRVIGGAIAGRGHLQAEMKRLIGEMSVLIAKKGRLKRTRPTPEAEEQPDRTPADDEVRSPIEIPIEEADELRRAPIVDLYEDPWAGPPVEAVIDSNVRDEAAGILRTLSPKEEKVVRLRFGIGCQREHTLEEIGQEFGLTGERIRQIETEALRQLRAPERARRLRALMAARL